MNTIFSIGVDALAYGMVLFVISIGLSVTMGLMRVVNLAHGAFAMIGGYIASYAAQISGLGYAAAVLLAVAGTVIIAIPIERAALPAHLRCAGAHPGADDHRHHLLHHRHRQLRLRPDAEDDPAAGRHCRGSVDLGFRSIATHRLFAIVCGLIVAAALWYAIEKTAFGVKLRAAVDNAAMAAALGVRTEDGLCGELRRRGRALRRSAASSVRNCCRSSPITRCATW